MLNTKVFLPQLTFLRFLAATVVIIFHYGTKAAPFQSMLFQPIITHGSTAVSFFFFLSGVVLFLSYFYKPNSSLKEFYIKRFARIYPIYFIAFILALVLAMSYGAFPKGISIVLQLLGLHAWHPGIVLEINYTSWSVSVELFFYLLFPFILPFTTKLSVRKNSIFIILFWLVSCVLDYTVSQELNKKSFALSEFCIYFPLWHLNTFLFGVLCGKVIVYLKNTQLAPLYFYRLLYMLGLSILILLFYTENPIKDHAHNGLISPIFFIVLLGLSLDNSLLTKILSHRFLIILGNASYAMYIFQYPLELMLDGVYPDEYYNTSQFWLFYLLLTALGIVIYFFLEKRFQKNITHNLIKK